MPVCFGISFTSTFLNQANALVHVYTDGSVGISTGAVGMGQGVNAKIVQIAAITLGVDLAHVHVESTNTTRNANTSPTAASSGADMNGNATRMACEQIRKRMLDVAATKLGAASSNDLRIESEYVWNGEVKTDLDWNTLVSETYMQRVSLSEQAHYATPNIHFDRVTEKGDPFAYHVFGTAAIEVTLDALRGVYSVDHAWIIHDAGRSIVPLIDRGQVEGALWQGIGWMTMEELVHDQQGRLLSADLATYKIPDIHFSDAPVDIHFLENVENPPGPYHSKAIGEPPFMYGIAAFFALRNAMIAFKPKGQFLFETPLTPEKVLLQLYPELETP